MRMPRLFNRSLVVCLLYADDIVLFSNSLQTLVRLLKICEVHSIANRYLFNVAKCALISYVTI